jgi:hypothetical protein
MWTLMENFLNLFSNSIQIYSEPWWYHLAGIIIALYVFNNKGYYTLNMYRSSLIIFHIK